MNIIVFRGEQYDAATLIRCASLGHIEDVKTQDIEVNDSCDKNSTTAVGFRADGKIHLLAGSLTPEQSSHKLRIITKHILRKALLADIDAFKRTDLRQNTQGYGELPQGVRGASYGRQKPAARSDDPRFRNTPRFSNR